MKKSYQLKQLENTENQILHHDKKDSLRINKYLTACGYCSRRKADKLVEENRVTIDGVLATVGSQVMEGQQVLVDGQAVAEKQNHVYIALNKPIGITCTTDREIEGNITDFMDYNQRIFPIGRLDKDSSGLILLTSDGDVVNKILRAENNHEKEYLVNVDQEVTAAFLHKMGNGVEITNTRTKTRETTKKCLVEKTGPKAFRLVLTQGLNRQIRRMCTALGYKVTALNRVRIMNIKLGNLKRGQWRYLTQQELDELNKSIQ